MSRVKKLLVVATGLVGVYVILVFFSISGRPSSKPTELFELFQRTEAAKNVLDAAKYLLVNVDKNDTETSNLKIVRFLKGLNQHTWEKNCQKSLEHLCNFPIFPKAPDIRSIADNVDITSSTKEVDGIRLLGYLKPNVTGEFLFSVKSNGFVEVWLGKSTSWGEGTKIAQYPAKPEESSLGVKLLAYKKYYIDIVYARGGENNGAQIQLLWKRPDLTDFEVIDGQYFAPYKNDSDKARMKVYDDDLPDVLACASLRLKFANKHMKSETTSYLESAAVSKALNFCEYKPSYLLDPANLVGFGQYHGVYRHAHKTYSFPYSNVDGIARNPAPGPAFMAENPLEEQEARSVVDKYITALEKSYDG